MEVRLLENKNCDSGNVRFGQLGVRRSNSFTLIEVIGVIAVLSIAAGVMIPNVIKKINITAANNEAKILKNIADALQLYITRNWSIPSATNWADAIGFQMGWDSGSVLTNDRRIARAFIIDPRLRIGETSNSTLPFLQTVNGSIKPISPRLMIISSLSEPLPVTSGVMNSASDFDAIWNTVDDAVPSVWQNWKGKGELLKIQRINLMPLFKYVAVNKEPGATDTRFGIATNYDATFIQTRTFGTNNFFGTYYLNGTIILLYRTNNTVDMRQAISTDTSFYFAGNDWSSDSIGSTAQTRDYSSCIDYFLAAPPNKKARNNVQPTNVVVALVNYMNYYVQWANVSFNKKSPVYSLLNSAQNDLQNKLYDLMWKPGQ